ncbi:MAG: hypothetical protein K9N48_02285 [Verrucomicrobia bacterium]|nr:hypothetical protein [Verrucomicrobiota bacterium]
MKIRNYNRRCALLKCIALVIFACPVYAGLDVIHLGELSPALDDVDENAGSRLKWERVQEEFSLEERSVVIRQCATDTGGNTSVRNSSPLKWKDEGYFQRNRDLGQVFTVGESGFELDAIILRTGNDTSAFLTGAAGAPVFIQFFEVIGEPEIDDNGTPKGAKATHGFSTNHRCDDFVKGVEYKSLCVVRGGVMPDLADAGDGRFQYMKWDLTGESELYFEPGRRYAFMVGITAPGPECGFTLANRNNAASPAPPSMFDSLDRYHGGWGLRREGNGKKPPTMIPGDTPPEDSTTIEKLENESFFPKGDARFCIPPTCDGYPDVDAYRDLEFYLIAGP